MGRYEKQRGQLELALQVTEKHFGMEHAKTAKVLSQLSVPVGKCGDYGK
jgi:hypothetical protein